MGFSTKFRFSALCLVLMTIGHSPGSADRKLVCNTLKCRRLGEYYRENMNPNGNACNNFYDYVCHNWRKNNPRPVYEAYWSVDTVMQERTYRFLKLALEEKGVSNDTQVERAKAWFKTCSNRPFMKRFDPVEIKKFLPRTEEWPMFSKKKEISFWEIDNHYIKLTGDSALFDISIDVDKDEHGFATKFDRLESPYGMTHRFLPWYGSPEGKKAYLHYKALLSRLIKAVAPKGVPISDETIDRDIAHVIQLREIIRLIDADTIDAPVFYTTIGALQGLYNVETKFSDGAAINFLEQARAIYNGPIDPHNFPLRPNSIIKVKHKYVMDLANKILLIMPARVIANHIHLYFLERHLVLDTDMQVELVGSFVSRPGLSDLLRYEQPRWKTCLSSETMSVTLSKIYIKSFFPKEKKRHIEKLFEEAKQILREQISRSNWLDPQTKGAADYKLKQLRGAMGYSQVHESNQPISSSKDPLTIPIKVNAINAIASNLIYVGASYLQFPIYMSSMPFAIDYGAVVGVLGHELYHSFDAKGVLRDHTGAVAKVWSDRMLDKYKQREIRLQGIYNEYNMEELKRRNGFLDNVTLDTFNEDLGDVMGLKVAYQGFVNKLRQVGGQCPVLAGFENFDCTKLFFISFASTYCEGSRPDFEEQIIMASGYSLTPVRVNGAVSNLKEFSQAFGCKPGDRLALRNTFDFWQT